MIKINILFVVLITTISCSQSKSEKLFINRVDVIQLSDYQRKVLEPARGKILLVNFWATWCGPCRAELKDFNEAWTQLGRDNINFQLVSIDDKNDTAMVKKYLESNNLNLPSYILEFSDPDKVIQAIDPTWTASIPHTLIYDTKGELLFTMPGAQTKSILLNKLKPLI